MSNYSIQIDWSGKDALLDTDPEKVVSGDDFDTEFSSVQTAINTKADINGDLGENFSVNQLTATTGTIGGEAFITDDTYRISRMAHPIESNTVELSSAGVTLNLQNTNTFIINVNDDGALAFSNAHTGMEVNLLVKNTGVFDIAFSGNFSFAGGNNPVITQGANKVDLIRCVSDGAKLYRNMTEDLT